MRLALCITTHARADALAAVLACVAAQTCPPDEVLIAEDGEDPATAAVSDAAAARLTAPLRHLRQPHAGFRVARLRNLALAAARSDYLVFIDGDMLLHPAFIADHRRLARPGAYTQGVRVNLDARMTADLLADPATAPRRLPHAASPGRLGLRRAALLRSTTLQPVLRRVATAWTAIKSCNQGFWRSDLLTANGWDERFEGWGPEDKELCARLEHAGLQRQTLAAGGIACHLHHAPAARDRRAINESMFETTVASRATRCALGVDHHLVGPDPRAPSGDRAAC